VSRIWHPADPDGLPELLARQIAREPGNVRVAVDGPACASPDDFAAALLAPLNALGRAAIHIHAAMFWRDASLRLEYGHEDPDAYLNWLDAEALRREVLLPFAADASFLPSLRDPNTNRATHAVRQQAAAGSVLLVSGSLLLGLGLPLDLSVHLAMSPQARARRTPAAQAWTLEALDRYDELAEPVRYADVVIRVNDPAHPAISLAPEDDLVR
jgi:hypothetical protein